MDRNLITNIMTKEQYQLAKAIDFQLRETDRLLRCIESTGFDALLWHQAVVLVGMGNEVDKLRQSILEGLKDRQKRLEDEKGAI